MAIIILYIITTLILNEFFIKKKYIQSFTGSKHQQFVNSSVPLSGGVFLILPMIYIFFNDFKIMSMILTLLFLIGLLSDLSLIISPKKKIFNTITYSFCFCIIYKIACFTNKNLFYR